MTEVDTLVIIESRRTSYAADDVTKAMRWSCGPSTMVVVVAVGDQDYGNGAIDNVVMMKSQLPPSTIPGFHAATALHWAIEQGIVFKQAFMVDDLGLVINPGLGAWGLEKLAKGAFLIGVLSRLYHADAFTRVSPLFDEWNLPHANWDPTAETIVDGFQWLSYATAAVLFQRDVLSPPGLERWRLPYGAYLSWAVQMSGMPVLGWGMENKHLFPLYVAPYLKDQQDNPPPHILSDQFMYYWPVTGSKAYGEEELREIYKRVRGEPHKQFQPLSPRVSLGADLG